MVIHPSAKFGARRQCGSGDMFLVVKEQDSICSHLNPSLLLIFV